jgi:hypothetical protein
MKTTLYKYVSSQFCCFVVFAFFSAAVFAKPEVMVVKYSGNIVKDHRPGHNYILDLMKLVLEQTRPEFGDYQLQIIPKELTAMRKALLVSEGEVINISDSPPLSLIANAGVIPIPMDIFKGLLGYRECIINSSVNKNLDAIKDINMLRNITIGQGLGWPDVEVYSFNNIKTATSSSFDGLFGMLAFNRFDCLALGLNEIDLIYADKKNSFPVISVDKKLLILYEYPFYFYVSDKHPKIADRFDKGMKKIILNKQFDMLFDTYFHGTTAGLDIKNRNLICLESPFSAKKNQCSKANISASLSGLSVNLSEY